MDSQGISSQGTLIYLNGVLIGELKDITPPPRTRKTIDTSTHNSDDDSVVVGIRRKGELQFTVNYLPHVDQTLDDKYETASKDEYKIIYPTDPVIANRAYFLFSGFVTNVGPKAPVDGNLDCSYSVKPTGGHIQHP